MGASPDQSGSGDGTTPWAIKPTLHGKRVTLRPYLDADLPHLVRTIADPDVQRLTGSVHTSTAAAGAGSPDDGQLRAWYATRNEQTDRLDLMVVDRKTNQCVGEVVLNDWNQANESCNFRIDIGPDGSDRRLGSEATRMTVEYAFIHLPVHRIELEVYAFNPRAYRVYEKAGFIVEGRRREAFRFDGERVDAIVMSILKPEWESRRGTV
jgi:RimJ/RimL family protein N-acetyltransferase